MDKYEYYKQTLQALNSRRNNLLSTENISGFGVMLNPDAQPDENPYAIRIDVEQLNELKNAYKHIDGIPVLYFENKYTLLEPDSSLAAEKYNVLKGGIQIKELTGPGTGTFGGVVRKTKKGSETDSEEVYGITNSHCINYKEGLAIYHPEKTSSPCCKNECCIGGRIGQSDKASPYGNNALDAALIKFDSGIEWCNEVVDIGVMKGAKILSGVELLNLSVQKRGVTTLLTKGKITATDYTVYIKDPRKEEAIRMDHQCIVTGVNETSFCKGGDSGSLVLNDGKEVVALLLGGRSKKESEEPISGICTPIKTVMEYLDVEFLVGPQKAKYCINRNQPTNNISFSTPERKALILELVDRHAIEVMRMVNHCRAVTIVWQRLNGPSYVDPMVSYYQSGNIASLAGLDYSKMIVMIKAMREILYENGDFDLRADLIRYGDEILDEIEYFARQA